ncbi:ATPdependent RNA helicase [Schistosoma haematobium]|uniref:ATPdependent RNA helicase n=2 Tax=Schistosoma haematobium TaxID=6185 RepID=A0A922LW78_SCHHA|nr:ATPdependent RNA helicase [Schistosoma haematobium]KAH9595047.1 ATPdependent RNA helicase [Schistosoma haematobium]
MNDNLDNDSIRTEDYASKFNETINLPGDTHRTNSYQPVQSLCAEIKKSSSTATLLPTWHALSQKNPNVNSDENHINLHNSQIIFTKKDNTSDIQHNSTVENKSNEEKYHTNSLIPYEMNSINPPLSIDNKSRDCLQSISLMNVSNEPYQNDSRLLNNQSMKGCYYPEKSCESGKMNNLNHKKIHNDKIFNEIHGKSKLPPVTYDHSIKTIIPSVNNIDQSANKKSDFINNDYYPPFHSRLSCEIRQNEQYLDRSITSQSFSLKGRCDHLKGDINQVNECVRISGITLNKEEIMAIINERDELYEILRVNEEEASERYSTEKRLMSIKQEFTAEQQRLRQIITALEEELEVTMCRLNQLTAERSKWTTELDETKNERNEMKEKLKNTEENHKVELMEMENAYQEKLKQMKLDEIKNSDIITKEYELKINHSINEQIQQTTEFEEKLQKLNKTIKEMEQEKENLRHENVELMKEHRERERLIRSEYEEILESKSVEKSKEISKLMDVHSIQLNELVEQMQKEKIQAINEIRSCYTENIEELQNKLLSKQTEIQTLNETLTNTQNLLHESRNQEILEKLKVQTVEAHSKELVEWEKEKFELWKIKMNELKDEKDSFIETMKQELQEQKDLTKFYQDKMKTIQKESDTYQTELERKIITLENQIETLKMKHEIDRSEIQQVYNQKLSNMELQHSREIKQAVETENVTVQKQVHEKNQAEKDKILEDLISSSTQIASKIGNLVNDIYHIVEWNVQNLYSFPDFTLDLDAQVMPNKEIEIANITKKWTINDISIEGVMESLMKHVDELANNLRKNSMDILAQLQRRKDVLVTQIRSELDSAHSAVKRIQEQTETEQDEHKMTLKHYRNRIEELEDEAIRKKLIEQLKLKDDEIECLKNEIQQLQQEIKKSTIERNKPDHEEANDSQQPIRIITELKARIQRLREENMALRRLLLRRPLVPVKQSDQESEQRPFCKPSDAQFMQRLKSKGNSERFISKF